jgi:hypothetical protein
VSRHELPPVLRIGFDWGWFVRWCGAGALAMFVWLSLPTARCSWAAFKGTPLTDMHGEEVDSSNADRERVVQSRTFFSNLIESTTMCYARTPLLGQEPWKANTLLALSGVTAFAWAMRRYVAWSKRTG